MMIGISGNYNNDTNMQEILRQRNDTMNQDQVQSAASAAQQTQQQNNVNNQEVQRLKMDSNSTDSTPNKHSRNLIDIMA
jgi:hypothetical protein